MNTTVVVIVIALMVSVGLYIGVSNLAQQYGIEPGSSNANLYACTSDRVTAKVGQAVKFVASVPEGTGYYWSAPDGTSSFVISGPLTATYARTGTKTAFLFYALNDRWYRSTCTVVIQ